VIRVKVLPTGPEIESEKLLDSLKNHIGEGRSIKNSKVEPIAFGLYALIVDVISPEGEAMVDAFERSLASTPLVAQYEIQGVSRMSSRVRTG
jgi:translation elongation factor aEF-1 beta